MISDSNPWLAAVSTVYEQYREIVERQHKDVMAWADIRAGMPKVESRLEFSAGGIQLLVRFPVELDNAVMIDEQVTKAMVFAVSTSKIALRDVPFPIPENVAWQLRRGH